MKKALSLLLAFALIFSMCFGLISCANTNNPSDDNSTANNPSDDNSTANNPSGNNPAQEPFSVDLAGYVANIGNATALGISKKTKTSASPMASYGTNNSGIQLLSYSTLASDKDTEDKNYIVMSTTDYDANAPEADKTGLTKVTFTKIVTENVTTETTGTKYIIANEGKISIYSTEGFKYTVYYNDSLVYNEVQDNDSNDKDLKIGVIVLDNLNDGMEYKVNYKGIGVETTITQDEINGEIDKLCVMNGYTFISFVPIGTSQRPANTQNIEKDVNGYITYDKVNYCSNNSRQSFVIANDTGYVYPIKDVTIQRFHNNLLLINNLVYDYNIVNDNLNFFPLFTNKTIQIKEYMKDKYGNNYVINDRVSSYDESTKTTYIKDNSEKQYFLMPSNEVMFVERIQYTYMIRKLDRTGEMIKLSETDNMPLDIIYNYDGYIDVRITRIENGYIYMHWISSPGSGEVNYERVNVENDYYERTSFGIYGNGWELNALNAVWVDDNHVVFYTDLIDGIGKLYTAQVWKDMGERTDGFEADHPDIKYMNSYHNSNLEDYINRTDEIKPILLLDGCIQENYNNHTYSDWRLSVSNLSGTNYYKIVFENGKVFVVNERNYIAPAPQNYTLHPLNK